MKHCAEDSLDSNLATFSWKQTMDEWILQTYLTAMVYKTSLPNIFLGKQVSIYTI